MKGGQNRRIPGHESKPHKCQIPVKSRQMFAQTPQSKAFTRIPIMFLATTISNLAFSET